MNFQFKINFWEKWKFISLCVYLMVYFLWSRHLYTVFLWCSEKSKLNRKYLLTLKRLGGRVNLFPPCGFSKNVSSKERLKPWFFVNFNIILKHIFPENFIEFPQFVQKIWRNSLSILAIFINFPRFFGFFDITLL